MKSLRFILSLDAGIKLEQDVIDYLEAHPQGRRQNKVRELLVLGVAASRNGRQSYDRTHYSGLEPQSHRVCVYLRDDSPDDAPVMAAIKDVLRPYQPAWLKEALVLGHLELSTQEEKRGTVLAIAEQLPARPAVSLARLAAVPPPAPGQDVGVQRHLSSSVTDSPAWTAAPALQERAGLESQSVGVLGDAGASSHSRTANAPSSATPMTNPSAGESGGSLTKVNDIDEGERTPSLKQVIQGMFQ